MALLACNMWSSAMAASTKTRCTVDARFVAATTTTARKVHGDRATTQEPSGSSPEGYSFLRPTRRSTTSRLNMMYSRPTTQLSRKYSAKTRLWATGTSRRCSLWRGNRPIRTRLNYVCSSRASTCGTMYRRNSDCAYGCRVNTHVWRLKIAIPSSSTYGTRWMAHVGREAVNNSAGVTTTTISTAKLAVRTHSLRSACTMFSPEVSNSKLNLAAQFKETINHSFSFDFIYTS